VVELVDTLDLKSNGHYGRAGSSPASSTDEKKSQSKALAFFVSKTEPSKNQKNLVYYQYLLTFWCLSISFVLKGTQCTTILFSTKTPTPPTIAMVNDNLVLCRHWLQMH
jgi:hypothetical protein